MQSMRLVGKADNVWSLSGHSLSVGQAFDFAPWRSGVYTEYSSINCV